MGPASGRQHASFDARQPGSRLGGWQPAVPDLGAVPRSASLHAADVPARPGKHGARQAVMAVRFGQVRIRRPAACSDRNASPEVELFAIEVRELNPPPGETQILWRLLTTHTVETVEQAITVVGWYRLRWHIEQLFRTLKRQGLRVEESVIEDGEALEKLVVIALIVATITMQLVLAIAAGSQGPPASRVFTPEQIEVIACSAAKTARPHPQAAEPVCTRRPRLGCLDRRPPGRLDRIPFRSFKRSYNHDGRTRAPCWYRRWLYAREKCVPKLAFQGEGAHRIRGPISGLNQSKSLCRATRRAGHRAELWRQML